MRVELIATLLQVFIISQHGCDGISCFTCSSRNGSDPHCEDPFQAKLTSYTERCKVPKRGYLGLFPAHFCVKLMGRSMSTNERLVIRRCVVDNMENQCNRFKYDNDTYHGCVLTCATDGCNASNRETPSPATTALISLCTILFLTWSSKLITTAGESAANHSHNKYRQMAQLTEQSTTIPNPSTTPRKLEVNLNSSLGKLSKRTRRSTTDGNSGVPPFD